MLEWVTVNSLLDETAINYTTANSNATVQIVRSGDIPNSDPMMESIRYLITVTAVDGVTQESYYIDIAKPIISEKNTNLSSLNVTGCALENVNGYATNFYSCTATELVDISSFTYTTASSSATVSISKRSGLASFNNVEGNWDEYTILVTAGNGEDFKNYYIYVDNSNLGD